MCGGWGRSWVGKVSDSICPVVYIEEAMFLGNRVVSVVG